MNSFYVVIPARYASTRLPGKPLADIGGVPMVVRVAQAAQAAKPAGLWVAADDARIVAAVESYGFQALQTGTEHTSGTERLAEVVRRLNWPDEAVVVNVQGDEPLLAPALIQAVAAALIADSEAAMATAAHPIHEAALLFDPNVVKVVADKYGRALYFSRAPIPWHRDAFAQQKNMLPADYQALRHIGIYAYRAAYLRRYAGLSGAPGESWEALEQLRALWHGEKIRVVMEHDVPQAGVDTPEDLERVRAWFAARTHH